MKADFVEYYPQIYGNYLQVKILVMKVILCHIAKIYINYVYNNIL